MKKTRLIATIICAAFLTFGIAGCADDEDETTNSSTSQNPTQTEAESSATSLAKGGEYSKSVTIDLSESELSDGGVAKFSVGSDVTDYFVLSESSASRTAANYSSIKNFRAIVEAIAKKSIKVKLTATAPDSSCKVVITMSIPKDYTASGKPVVKNVAVVNVGTEAKATESEASQNLSDYTVVTRLTEKKIFCYTYEYYDGETTKEYYSINADGTGTYSEYADGSGEMKSNDHSISFANGKISDDDNHYLGTLYKKGDAYYLIKVDEDYISRTSGNGLFATFTEEEESDGITATTILNLKSDGSISGTFKDEYKTEGKSEEGTLTGSFTNNNGILDIYVLGINDNGEEDDFIEGLYMYDGDKLMPYMPLTIETSLPQ